MSDSTPNLQLPVINPKMSCACKWRIGVGVLAGLLICGSIWLWSGSRPDPSSRLPAVSLGAVGSGVRRAIEDATELVRRKPFSGPAWGRLGMVLLAHNFEAAAETAFDVAQELDPRTARWSYCAGVGQAVIDPARAIVHFQHAVELAPNDPWPKFRLAELLMDTQQLDQAAAVLQSIQAPDQQTRLSYDRVRLALLHNDPQTLKKLDQQELKALQTGANRRVCLELLVQVYHRLGRNPDAAAIRDLLHSGTLSAEGWDDPYVTEIFQLRKDPQWLASVAHRELRANRADQSVQQLEELVNDYPDDPTWPLELGRVWKDLKQPGKAIQVLQGAAKQHPDSAQIQFEIGNLQFGSGNWSAAESAYSAASRLKPDFALAHYNLGQSRLKLQHDEQALQAFRDALRSQPDLAPALINLADLLSRSKRPADLSEARLCLQRALMVAPRDRRAAELLERLPKE